MTNDSAFIPGLEPYGLAVVPGYRTKDITEADGTVREVEDQAWRDEWFAWRDKLNALRLDIHYALVAASPQIQRLELELCAKDPAYWLAIYGWIDEPRPRPGENYFKEFAPFAYQVHLLQWFVEHTDSPVIFDGYVSKARGLGATWIFCAGAVWGWLFREWRGLLVSRKEDLVDKPRDLNSMFGKIDLLVDFLPGWMVPSGYDKAVHRTKMAIQNPNTRGQITGESTTTKAGRGARATYILYDEAAFIVDFQDVFATGAGTSDHRFAISSESHSVSYYWWDTWNAVKKIRPDAVQELNYYHNAYFGPDWFLSEFARWEGHDPLGFQREYLRDPWAGFGTEVYPIASRLDTSSLVYEPSLPVLVGIDPGLADDTAIVFAQWEGDGPDRKLRFFDSYENRALPAEFYAHILTGIYPIPGDKCYALPFTNRDKAIMQLTRGIAPSMMQVACDPAGGQRDTSGLSFVERIIQTSRELREREGMPGKAVIPFYKDIFKLNAYGERQRALQAVLIKSVFADTNPALRIKTALMKYRYNEPGSLATSERKPVHDQYSHLATACEYLAVWIELNVIGAIPKPDAVDADKGYAKARARGGSFGARA